MQACTNCRDQRIRCNRRTPRTSCSACLSNGRLCFESPRPRRILGRFEDRSQILDQEREQRREWSSMRQVILRHLTGMRDGLQAIQHVHRFQQNSQTLLIQAQSLRDTIEMFTFDRVLVNVPLVLLVRQRYRVHVRRVERMLLQSLANLQRRYALLVHSVSWLEIHLLDFSKVHVVIVNYFIKVILLLSLWGGQNK